MVADEGFESRVESWFRAEAGKPLRRAAKQPPLAPGRGNYTRAYSYSIVGFAARCFYLGEMLDEANAALVENARHYLDNPKDIIDRDSFHWHADIVMRLDRHVRPGRHGPSRAAHSGDRGGLPEADLDLRQGELAKHNKPDHATTKTWHFHSTENHHAMDFSLHWHFAKIAKDKPDYRKLKLDDGSSLGGALPGMERLHRRLLPGAGEEGRLHRDHVPRIQFRLAQGILQFP